MYGFITSSHLNIYALDYIYTQGVFGQNSGNMTERRSWPLPGQLSFLSKHGRIDSTRHAGEYVSSLVQCTNLGVICPGCQLLIQVLYPDMFLECSSCSRARAYRVPHCDCASKSMAADKLKAEKEVRAQAKVCQVSNKIQNTAMFKSIHEASICLCFSLP